MFVVKYEIDGTHNLVFCLFVIVLGPFVVIF